MLTVVRINCFFLAVSVRFSINRPVRSRLVGVRIHKLKSFVQNRAYQNTRGGDLVHVTFSFFTTVSKFWRRCIAAGVLRSGGSTEAGREGWNGTECGRCEQ